MKTVVFAGAEHGCRRGVACELQLVPVTDVGGIDGDTEIFGSQLCSLDMAEFCVTRNDGAPCART